MKIPFFPPLAAGDPSGTVNLALFELGLTERYLVSVLKAVGLRAKLNQTGELDFDHMECSTWIFVCRLLHLPVDCFSGGYVRSAHVHWVGGAIQEGTFLLPKTKQMERLFREFMNRKRASIEFEAEYLGDRLRKRAKEKRYVDAIKLRRQRKKTLRRNAKTRRFLLSCFINGSPSIVQLNLPKSRTDKIAPLPGLTTVLPSKLTRGKGPEFRSKT